MSALEQTNPFSISAEREDGFVVLSIAGEIDIATAPDLDAAIRGNASASESVCLDFSACTFIDSTGLAVVLRAARDFRNEGGRLAVRELHEEVARIFDLAGLLVDGSAVVRSE